MQFDDSIVQVMRHQDWRYLLRSLLNSTYGHSLRGLSSRELVRALLAPAAAARAIATLSPELMQQEHLKILIAGAEFQDTTDDGQWYQLIPWLLGRPTMKVDVTLVGLQIDEPEDIPLSEIHKLKVRPGLFKPAKKYSQHFSEFLDANDVHYDLICFFNPGFGGHAEWYQDDVLRRLMQVGDIVLGSSFGPTEVPDDMFMANLFGIQQIGKTIHNPFSLRAAPDSPTISQAISDLITDTNWGYVLWRISLQSDFISPHASLFVRGLEILDANMQASKDFDGLDGMDSLQQQFKYAGIRTNLKEDALPAPDFPPEHHVILSFDNHIIDAETGEFYDLENGVYADNIVPMELLAAYPEAALNEQHPLPLVLWSLAVWHQCMIQNEDEDEMHGMYSGGETLGDLFKSVSGESNIKESMRQSMAMLMGGDADMLKHITESILGKENRTVPKLEKPIIDAYKRGDFTHALSLIESNPTLVDAMDETWVTGLYYAAPANDAGFTASLLEHDASLEHRDGEGWTPLMYAAHHNASAVVNVLLNAGANPDAQSPLGFTPLHFAVSRGSETCAMLLLDCGASVDIPCSAGYTVRELAQNDGTPHGELRDRVLAAKR